MTKEIHLTSIERTQWVIAAVFTLGSIAFWDWRITLGVVCGGIICILNFRAMRMIFERGFARTKSGAGGFIAYIIKALALLAIVVGVVFLLRGAVNLIAFLVGLLTIFLAVAITGLRGYRFIQ
jgi:hypothetical protein